MSLKERFDMALHLNLHVRKNYKNIIFLTFCIFLKISSFFLQYLICYEPIAMSKINCHREVTPRPRIAPATPELQI